MANIRKVAETTKLPHIREFLLCEIVARSVKKIVDKQVSHMIYRAGSISKSFPAMEGYEIEKMKAAYAPEFTLELKRIVLNILNYTMGDSEEARYFWETYVKSQVYYDYNYLFASNFAFEDLSAGSLIHSCFFHFNLQMRDRKYILEKIACPFKLEDIIDFKVASRMYGFKKHKLRNLTNVFEKHRDEQKYALALKLLDIKLSIEQNLFREQDYLDTLAEIADIYLLKEDYDQSIDVCKRAVNRLSSYSPTTIKFLCIMLKDYIKLEQAQKILETFDIAIAVIVYNFGIYHPLHSTFNSFLAYTITYQLLLLHNRGV